MSLMFKSICGKSWAQRWILHFLAKQKSKSRLILTCLDENTMDTIFSSNWPLIQFTVVNSHCGHFRDPFEGYCAIDSAK